MILLNMVTINAYISPHGPAYTLLFLVVPACQFGLLLASLAMAVFIEIWLRLLIASVAIAGLITIAGMTYLRKIREASEGSAKGCLVTMRSALQTYRHKNNGKYPASIAAMMPDYIESPMTVNTAPYHEYSDRVLVVYGDKTNFTDTGAWIYNSKNGKVFVNCTHTDRHGTTISTW